MKKSIREIVTYMVNNPSGPKSMPPILGGNRFTDF